MGQHHLFHLLDLFQQIVGQSPVPTGFQNRPARSFQALEKASVVLGRVALDPCFLQFAACFVLRREHAIAFVNIDPDVIHENSSFLFPGAYAPQNCFHVT
jgi:hypothetical protein